jgi:hypothetical protein
MWLFCAAEWLAATCRAASVIIKAKTIAGAGLFSSKSISLN